MLRSGDELALEDLGNQLAAQPLNATEHDLSIENSV